MLKNNEVDFPPVGLILALQYWQGDKDRAMRLARLLRNIEIERRDDVTIWFCPRFDLPWDTDQQLMMQYVSKRFRVGGPLVSTPAPPPRKGAPAVGHPDGPNAMFERVMGTLYEQWSEGAIRSASSVFLIEADGVPLSPDWLERLQTEHWASLTSGRRVTGCLTTHGGELPHINGSLIAHLSVWPDRQSLHHTPKGQAWDVFHAATILQEARHTNLIKNVYGAIDWTPGTLANMARETAWLASTKDDSALDWAERFLTAD